MKRWGRHLATTANSEMLPKWYYVVDEAGRPPATCAIKVDSGGDSSEVDGFRLANVVDAAKAVYRNCLDRKGQVGLEFPGDGHIFAQLMRLDGMPPHGLLQQAGGARDEGGVRMERMPGGKVLYVSDLEPGMPGNVSQTS
ncbi:MAG: hypothetical protein L6R41_006082 [Letrouitia leprolyta]|nr:MAG: hypothetical protein L6R41_006082 [Letrouitia leprolyta]